MLRWGKGQPGKAGASQGWWDPKLVQVGKPTPSRNKYGIVNKTLVFKGNIYLE